MTDLEPTAADLAAIEDEWPLIAAELAVVDALAAIAAGETNPLARRRLFLARRRLAAIATGFTPAAPDATVFRPIPVRSTCRRSA
ncbi:DUF6284 family protein [Candidatus Frankia nodulisporulans]|uniref:DUF6284 family protein n=1 Tax=Candidatus Frankia nodulisporulans TaxID=2060052 RepID=UPI0013D392D2|nr:DUF6284 family protein [Candidatus Frankia nodulisporulans]